MAQDKVGAEAPELEKQRKNFEAAQNALTQMQNLTRSRRRTTQSYTKEQLVSYIQNPASNEKNLRDVSNVFYLRCQAYNRLVSYYASLPNFDARIVIPPYDMTGRNNDNKILKSYYQTCNVLSHWNINSEFYRPTKHSILEDTFYGIAYYSDEGLLIYPMDNAWCKLYGRYSNTGDYSYAVDMSNFRGINNFLIDALGEPIKSMYDAYQSSGDKWQVMPDEYCFCIKFNTNDDLLEIPPLVGLFESLLDMLNMADVSNLEAEQSIYKMIYMQIPTISNSKTPDDFSVSPALATKYYNRLIEEAIPTDSVTCGISPVPLNTISFDNDASKNNNRVSEATKNVFDVSGGAMLLSSNITNSTAYNYAVKADTLWVTSPLLPQFEGWLNRILPYVVSNPSRVKFIQTGRLTTEDTRKELLEDSQYGLPAKLAVMALDGVDPLSTLSLNHLEEDILGLANKFDKPLSSSFTSSSTGRPADENSGTSENDKG